MQLLIPFASVLADEGRQALAALELPRLEALLGRLVPTARDEGDEFSLTPPHERALARALGLVGGDGCLPWAALHAREDGLEPLDLAWGEMTPSHWHVGAEQVSLGNPAQLGLGEAESKALLEAVRPLFEEDGWHLAWGAPLRWYVSHPSLTDLPCASLDRVVGRNVDLWLRSAAGSGSDPRVARLRRLQNEVQMLLFTHPLNAQREDRGTLAVNSFWLSGCGLVQPATTAAGLKLDDRLRASALAADWPAWSQAWRELDAGPVAEALAHARNGGPLRLSLCGERHVQTFEALPQSWWSRWRASWRRAKPADWLEPL